MSETHIVRAPRRSRCELARRAHAAGMTPTEFLAPVLARHTSLDGVATEMGVTRRAVEKWMQRYSIKVVRS